MLKASDAVKVRYSFGADLGTCYAVIATLDGKPVDGYLMGSANPAVVHPAILAFEQDIRLHATPIPQAVPAAPPAPAPAATAAAKPAVVVPVAKEAPPPPPAPLSFAGFRATDVNGERVDLSARRTQNVVLYFWSARNRNGIRATDQMESIYDAYHNRGVDVVGIASAANASDLLSICRNNEIIWPQVFDSGGIASRYHVDPANPYLVLDQSRHVIAALPSASALGPVLAQLTKNRRPIE